MMRNDSRLNPLHCGAVVASGSASPRRPRPTTRSQSPSLRGSGRFGRVLEGRPYAYSITSQSPSLRGSGRFPHGSRAGGPRDARLNPLHCGAVVASYSYALPNEDLIRVSIPFIAGQWSLPLNSSAARRGGIKSQSPSLRGSGRFPRSPQGGGARRKEVSIPFIAGQWSLRREDPRRRAASRHVSIPFIAGQWSLQKRRSARVATPSGVSIPFIAGQWSLQIVWIAAAALVAACLNPLHCGAVVASRQRRSSPHPRSPVSIPFIAGQWSLPDAAAALAALLADVSIPFIAGQWSLRPGCFNPDTHNPASQSPSLRGSGRFGTPSPPEGGGDPFVSIPFIAGQWSLPPPKGGGRSVCVSSQSPSLRGSGRFCARRMAGGGGGSASQSPSLRGSGRFLGAPAGAPSAVRCLNPLHCGAVVASPPAQYFDARGRLVSIPFIAGQWSLRRIAHAAPSQGRRSLNPLHCGAVVASRSPYGGRGRRRSLNPLHCGAVVASGG